MAGAGTEKAGRCAFRPRNPSRPTAYGVGLADLSAALLPMVTEYPFMLGVALAELTDSATPPG